MRCNWKTRTWLSVVTALALAGPARANDVLMDGCGVPAAACDANCDACGGCDNGCDGLGGGCVQDACGCQRGCDSCQDCLLGFIAPSDVCFSDFISPMTNPVFFEDPRTLSEVRFIFLHHEVPVAAGGGDIQLIAAQVRAALTDRLSIVAAKDGYAMSSNPLIEDGWADISVGLKYNLYADSETQRLLSTGLSYELPVGSTQALQGNGDGEFHLYLTGGAQLGCDWHWLSATGLRLPADGDAESSMWYWSNHLDRRLTNCLYFLTEVNWYNWIGAGTQPGLNGVEGGDLFNFGSTGVAGNDIVTGAFGLKYVPSDRTEIGVAWEVPLTERRDVLDNRLTVDWIFRY